MTSENKCEVEWVEKRAECSVLAMFLTVKNGAQADVKKRNSISKANGTLRFFGFKDNGSAFSVYTEGEPIPIILEFRVSDDAISVTRSGELIHHACITFTNECECKIVVNNEELYPWQFRKKILESLFF